MIFLPHLFLIAWTAVYHVTENRSGHITYCLLFWRGGRGRGMKITLWDWCLCLYMTFTALHFYLAPCSLVSALSHLRLPETSRCVTRGGEDLVPALTKQGVLGQAATAGNDASQRLWKGKQGTFQLGLKLYNGAIQDFMIVIIILLLKENSGIF